MCSGWQSEDFRAILGGRGTQDARWGGMKSRLGTVVALVFALAAGACFAPQQESMAGALDRYIGRPVADFAADHGEPTSSTIETGDRKAGLLRVSWTGS